MQPRIGIDLGGTKIEGVVLLGDEVASRVRLATPRNDYQATVTAIGELVVTLEQALALRPGEPTVGIGTPGAWIAARNRMQNCNSTWLNGQPLLTDLVSMLGPRVRIANDADCFALSEAVSGSGAGAELVLGLILGTGVGSGLVFNGRLLSGPNGLTGEWGHTPLAGRDAGLHSRRCYCGRLDCVETYLSGPGLHATHLELWPEEAEPPVDAEAVYLRAELDRVAAAEWVATDMDAASSASRARSTLALYCRMLAENLAGLVNVVDPHVIVLGGGLSQMAEIYAPVRERMREWVFGEVFETRLLAPRWGAASGVRGAAWLWL